MRPRTANVNVNVIAIANQPPRTDYVIHASRDAAIHEQPRTDM